MKNRNFFGQVLLLIAVCLCIYILASIGNYYRDKSIATLEKSWRHDIEKLSSENQLPVFWKDIRLIEKIAAKDDETAESWIKSVYPPIEINPVGQYKLELLFLSQEENGLKKAVIIHHIVYLPSGDSVWEIGRTYDLQ